MSPFTMVIILVLVISGIGGILFWLNTRLKHFFKIKITYWLMLIYTVVLLAATAIIPFFSKELHVLDAQERQDEDEIASEMIEKLKSGQTEKIDKKYILAEHSFKEVESETLTIFYHFENWSNIDIFVKRKDVNDGIIEATIYQQSFIIDGADFSELLEPYELTLADNRLTILSKQQDLNLSIMHSPFPVRQITNVSMMHHSTSRGDQLIYLQIPRDLKLEHEDENLYVRYVD